MFHSFTILTRVISNLEHFSWVETEAMFGEPKEKRRARTVSLLQQEERPYGSETKKRWKSWRYKLYGPEEDQGLKLGKKWCWSVFNMTWCGNTVLLWAMAEHWWVYLRLRLHDASKKWTRHEIISDWRSVYTIPAWKSLEYGTKMNSVRQLDWSGHVFMWTLE